jgi:hypothetical protein
MGQRGWRRTGLPTLHLCKATDVLITDGAFFSDKMMHMLYQFFRVLIRSRSNELTVSVHPHIPLRTSLLCHQ